NASDLADMSKLLGETEGRPVLSVDEIRTLKFGRAVMIAGSSRPIEARLTPFWKRKDGSRIASGRTETEQRVKRYKDEASRAQVTSF
ncbi:hypothetical protein AB0H83_21940, partial [Dactylosporangium sp. NPDC050688]|uniref:hypothetical protein n=1 Tax=Dactylosporangium sp. NPDC050688 TaxID=3157217 RepID=UPI0033FC7E15